MPPVFLPRVATNVLRWLMACLLLASMLFAPAAHAVEPFVIKDIRIEGIQRTDPGTVFASLPFRVGDTYNDVIQVHLTVSIEVPLLGSIDLTESDYYYANNVGLIENETYDALVGSPIVHRVLDSYSIP